MAYPIGLQLSGYWDILGDNSPPGSMSEVSSVQELCIGWTSYTETIRGPTVNRRTLRLRPLATTGEAIKLVPDTDHEPKHYFVLEYRKSTGTEAWRPEGNRRATCTSALAGLSGVWITNIRADGDAVSFELEVDGHFTTGWTITLAPVADRAQQRLVGGGRRAAARSRPARCRR